MDWLKATSVGMIAVALAGCAAPRQGSAQAPAGPGTPAAQPQRNVTSFNDALRCMDDLMLRFGTRDVSVMLEELQDKTGRLGAGSRDMMISAISDMTRRSRAVKLVAFGVDNANIVNFLQNLQRQNQFSLVPTYDIRGAITQFDNEVQRQQSGGGISLLGLLGLRFGKQSSVSVLGFDASVIQTADLTLVSGVHSKNIIAIERVDGGVSEASATIEKVGINFNMTFTRQDGQAQALRNMVELASIELLGKLTKVPYWTCLGIGADNPEIAREIEDWFIGLRDPADQNRFMQEQLRNRRFYDGPVDGRPNPALRQATSAYQKAIGIRETGRVDLAFFREFLNRPVPAAPDEPFSVADRKADELGTLTVESVTPDLKPGGPIELKVTSNTDAYLYCYQQNADGRIQRVFPNRFARDPRIGADKPLQLPGKLPFTLRVNAKGDKQNFACIGAGREIYNELPPPLRWSDFEDIGFSSFEELRQGFANATNGRITMTQLTVALPAAAEGEKKTN